MTARDPNFFVVGGTLHPSVPSYIKRPADDLLPQLVAEGELCYVLTSRQMGKSSLMVRTIHRLDEQSKPIQPVVIDLSAIGLTSIEQWYYSLVDEIAYQLKLATDIQTWWQQHSTLEYVSRFNGFLRDVVLTEVPGQIAIFIDEVDSVISYDFSDDFFAAVRAFYNRRAIDPSFKRVAFILLGTVAPHDLIKDYGRTPFNIGRRVKLDELKLKDAQVMAKGLPAPGEAILEHIFFWTNGHPYLTQKIGQAIAGRSDEILWTNERIDGLINELFLSNKALIEEDNLQFVQNRVFSSPHRDKLLRLYQQICHGPKKVKNDRQSTIQNELKIAGLVTADEQGYLTVQNQIYRYAFNLDWIRKNRPVNWWQRSTIGLGLVSVLFILGGLFYWLWLAPQPAPTVVEAIYIEKPPLIDGYLNDDVWAKAEPLTYASYNSANDSTTALVKLLWDEKYLYAGFEVNDAHVESSITPWDGDSVSVIIRNGSEIREYRHSLLGPERGDTRNQPISQHRLKEPTTFNNPTDEDAGYSVEMQIP